MLIKRKKVLFLFLVLFFILLGVNYIVKFYVRTTKTTKRFIEKYYNQEIENVNITGQDDYKTIGWTLSLALEENNWDNLKLSKNFKNKYKNSKGIIKNIGDYENIASGYDGDFAFYKKNIIWLCGDKYDTVINKLKYGQPVSTEFVFEYAIDENNLLDDIKLIRQKDVYSINGERVDGKPEVTYEYLPYYIHKFTNPENPDVDDYFLNIPFANNYQVLNKPDVSRLGKPLTSSCELDEEKVTLIFNYEDKQKKWNVKYNIDINYDLDYLEFIEI